ncbi:MAG: sigma-70 family RNA polymerase sigma factor [Pseudomonadales bacterium]|nr:sigma-70 family RNA polymerase sigma factor [Pseudomonadales bacterium]
MADQPLETPEFIERLRQGDRAAFGQLVKAQHNMLLATARTLLNPADAEEAVQDAWIAAHRAIAGFEGRSQLRTWLTRIVINQAKMMLRKRGREIQFDPADEQDPLAYRFKQNGAWQLSPQHWELSGPDNLLTREELRRCMEKHLHFMPDNQRLVLELRDLQGLPAEDVCNMLEISASNVRVLLHRARAHLFEMVDHFQETGEC